jgi:hypothetical protein
MLRPFACTDAIVPWLKNALSARAAGSSTPMAPKSYQCRCGRPVFFRNSRCLNCGSPLGYEPNLGRLYSLEPSAQADLWHLTDAGEPHNELYKRCANLTSASGCNWILSAGDVGANVQTLCQCCRLDRTIPDLSLASNAEAYHRISNAKRRLVSFLIALDLPVASRIAEDPERGLAFDFLRSPAEGPPVMTGHYEGIITLTTDRIWSNDHARTVSLGAAGHEPPQRHP